jgi:hypothetical protein
MRPNRLFSLAAAAFGLTAALPAAPLAVGPRFDQVPGVVIDHSPASSGVYIGSPSLAVLPGGDYVASHDHFGPQTTEHQSAVTAVFRSPDRGRTWQRISTIQGQFWSTLFVHRGALHLLGTDRHHGNAILRRSSDGGANWTSPTNAATGLLRDNGQYHCAPMPVIVHQGRLWRGMERRDPPLGWGITYCAGMLSAPVDADLLDATNWTFSNFLPGDARWLEGTFGGWLEGNAVVTRDGGLLDILRVDTAGYPEKAALVNVSPDGRTTSFDPARGFINFPGGAKKFTLRFDRQSDLYWSLATLVPEPYQKVPGKKPAGVRNTLALVCSSDLTNWATRCILLHHPDTAKHGFQYLDWLFDGDDLIAACRTAFDDGLGGAHNNHDANCLTFHRITNFRAKTMADSVPMAAQRLETRDWILTGYGWTLQTMTSGGKAFANRDYVWRNVPAQFHGWRYTQTGGGERAEISVQTRRDTTLHFATAPSQKSVNLAGWTPVPDAVFRYTDRGQTAMQIYRRDVKAGEEVVIPQGNWTGGLLLVPSEVDR